MTATTPTATHTPGPWSNESPSYIRAVRDGYGEQSIAAVAMPAGMHTAEHRANARLIAAAPALRATLQSLYNAACHHPRCTRELGEHLCSCGVSAALESTRALLASIDGQTEPRS